MAAMEGVDLEEPGTTFSTVSWAALGVA